MDPGGGWKSSFKVRHQFFFQHSVLGFGCCDQTNIRKLSFLRIELLYHLLNTAHSHRLRLRSCSILLSSPSNRLINPQDL